MFLLKNRETFAFSPENPTGTRNGGTRGKDCEKLNPYIKIQPGETVTLCQTDGPGMITNMWCTGYTGHSFILRFYWDDAEFPSVEAPLSAFFGMAYDVNLADRDGNYPVLNSALMLVAPERGCNCYFEMPFRKNCRVTVENRGKKVEALYYMIEGWKGDIPENAGYFHAVYRQEKPVEKGRSYVVLEGIEGKGRFMGITMAAGLNGHNTCWVEGETKLYIDGETYPSVNFTGTEDYFGGSYAFGNDGELHAYQPYGGLYAGLCAILGNSREMYNVQQRFLLYRWHVKDEIWFRKGFRMVMDNLGWTGPRYDDYATVAYWYGEKPTKPPFALPEDKDLIMK